MTPNAAGPKILVIIPAYNEAKSIAGTLADVRNHAPAADIVLVNDCSTDDTAKVARAEGSTVLNLPINLGIGGAVQTGFQWGVVHDYDVAIQFDGDGQHQAKFIERLIAPILTGDADLVVGSRFLSGPRTFKTTWSRRVGMIIFSKLYTLCTRTSMTDTTSGFRACNRRTMRYFALEYMVDFPDMPALFAAQLQGHRLVEVPVEMNQRQHGVSSTNLYRSAWYPLKTLAAALSVFLRRHQVRS